MKTNKSANLVDWITSNKELRNNDYSVTLKSLRLTDDQIIELKSLLKDKEELESGPVVFGNDVKAKLMWDSEQDRHGNWHTEPFQVPVGNKSYLLYPLDEIASLADSEVFFIQKLVSKKNKRYVKAFNNLLGNRDISNEVSGQILNSSKKQFRIWIKNVGTLHSEFMDFLWKIQFPCWTDHYVFDDTINKFVPPFLLKKEDKEDDCCVWCNYEEVKLLSALELLAEGKEVIIENIEPYKEVNVV